jgi:hypothetical protein
MALPNIDTGTVLLLAIGAVFLCVLGLLVVFGLQVVGTTLTTVFSTLGLLINGGPAVWCGCLVLILACGACVVGAILITSCNANPGSMNFCMFLNP